MFDDDTTLKNVKALEAACGGSAQTSSVQQEKSNKEEKVEDIEKDREHYKRKYKEENEAENDGEDEAENMMMKSMTSIPVMNLSEEMVCQIRIKMTRNVINRRKWCTENSNQ